MALEVVISLQQDSPPRSQASRKRQECSGHIALAVQPGRGACWAAEGWEDTHGRHFLQAGANPLQAYRPVLVSRYTKMQLSNATLDGLGAGINVAGSLSVISCGLVALMLWFYNEGRRATSKVVMWLCLTNAGYVSACRWHSAPSVCAFVVSVCS